MPYKDPQKAAECARKYREVNREKVNECNRRYRKHRTDEQKERALKLQRIRRNKDSTFRDKQKEYRQKNKDRLRQQRNEYVAAIKRQCIDYLGGKCMRCGLEDECVNLYDFHHRDPKEKDFTIGDARRRTFESLQEELDKCELLCANCHRRAHARNSCCSRHSVNPS